MKIISRTKIQFHYSGGGGGAENSYSGGGGCFLKYTGGRQLAALDNSDEGYVIISLIGLPKEDPKPMKLYLSLSFILGIGVATWCGCLMQWISKCMDWVLGEDQEWGLNDFHRISIIMIEITFHTLTRN